MTSAKKTLMKLYWLAGSVFFSSLLLVRCGTAADTGSTVAALDSKQGATLAAGAASYSIDPQAYANRKFIRHQDELNAIEADLRTLDGQTQAFTRYFLLTNLWNAGVSDKDLDIARAGINKCINSLSYARDIATPVAIDASKTIFRIDLRSYGWRRFVWDEVIRRDPYAFFIGSSQENNIRRATQVARVPWVRADWFAFNATQGALYHLIMEIPQNIRGLEFDLGVDVDRDIVTGNVIRAGFNGSGVSQQNRMMEYHRSRFGSYWKSYDFNPSAGKARRNLFEFPLDNRTFRGRGFDHAGGEVIYTLPNGLQAYILINNNDQRIDKAPTPIVGDDVRADKAVTNALSCFRCHSAGMIPAKDIVRPHVEKNAFAFSRAEVEFVRATYSTQDTIDKQIAADNVRYKAAMDKIGFSVSKADPLTHLALMFEAEMPPQLVAADFGLTINEFQTALQRSRFLTRRLGNSLIGGNVKREIFLDNFGFVISQFGLGQAFFNVGSFTLTQGGDDIESVTYSDAERAPDVAPALPEQSSDAPAAPDTSGYKAFGAERAAE